VAKNHQFALELAETINRLYPGLVLKVIQADARYNQHLHDKAIIVELGNQYSTLEEAKNSAIYLAEVIADYLRRTPESLRPLQGQRSPVDMLRALNNAGHKGIVR